ncbi:hypothetical protein KAU11_07810, partial [Candidatus Babeliales bacterium]|nr:hypothetical protein [Candidatus Babeliales bacterium]
MSDDFYSLADKAMRKCSSLGTDFADIRFQDRSSTVVRLKEKNVEEINNGQISGISVRVLHKGFLGFSSSNNLNDILKVAENAVKIAGSIRKGASKKNEVHLSESRTVKTNTETKTKRHPKDVDIREKIDLLRNANDAALSFSSLVKSIESIYVDEYIRNVYINSEGS